MVYFIKENSHKSLKQILFALSIALIVIATCLTVKFVGPDLKNYTPLVIRDYIQSFGAWGFLAYVAIYAVNTITIFPPICVVSFSAGLIFGPLWGTLATMLGTFIGTTVTFYIAKAFRKIFIGKYDNETWNRFESKFDKNGFWAILLIRLVWIVPWEFVNYAAGLSKIKYRDFILATLIGTLPSTIIRASFADQLIYFNIRDPKLIISFALFIALLIVPFIAKRFISRRNVVPTS